MNKPVIVRFKEAFAAVQWFKNGDHPEDDCFRPFEDTGKTPIEPREGKVVRYFRRPDVDGQSVCERCGQIMNNHGWIDDGNTIDSLTVVCPGDWVIEGGGYYRVSQEYFKENYEIVKTEE